VFESPNSALSRVSIDSLTGVLIFALSLLVFWFSPVRQVTDSHYSMLLSESLLRHRSFALDGFNLPRLEPNASTRDHYVMNGDIWQLELARGHIYYYFPPGSSILSLPFVTIANALGISAANSDGSYNPENETRIQTALAAILMALLAAVFYFTSRLILPHVWSIVIALAGAFGTQIWSTASRGLWSHTWAALLTGLIVYLLVYGEADRRKINPILLASLVAWLYFVRPNGSIVVGAVTVYVLLFRRELFAHYAMTGALWLAGFVAYSWIHFGKLLPSYYQTGRLRFDLLPVALAGNIFSPARGLFIYVPVLLFVLYLLVRFRMYLPLARLAWLSLAICGLHILFVSLFANLWGDWWGGASFGPRYTTELVPWFVLLSVLGLKGRMIARKHSEASVAPFQRVSLAAKSAEGASYNEGAVLQGEQANKLRYRAEVFVGALLLAASVFINARGATSLDTWKWSQPSTDQQLRSQLWDWSHPQFLAGLQSPKPPVEFPLLQTPTVIDVTSQKAGKYLWYGWSGSEKNLRWTDGREATLVFSLNETRELLLEMKLAPFIAGSELAQQHLSLKLNDQSITTLTLSDSEMRTYSFSLPKSLLRTTNVLTFELPDAASPASLNVSPDSRLLGIRVESIRFTDAKQP
jgi:hypothetical protein